MEIKGGEWKFAKCLLLVETKCEVDGNFIEIILIEIQTVLVEIVRKIIFFHVFYRN